jgi:uroporphyrin-III C-methyltransferase/precorrin-2 dehydrogenase/sirohydrochlorin ferrochelatase
MYHDNKYKKKGNRMSYFPFFREIEGEKCLVIGGGKVAARKISRLKGFGVKIKVAAPSIVSDIEAMAQACDNISIERRTFTQEDIEKADFVIAAAGEEVDKEAARLCKERSIPVNVVDNQELCDFIFPSIIRKGDMVAGFVTGGKSPYVAAKVRRDCEMNISDNIEDILDYLAKIRKLAKDRISDERKRAAYIRDVSEFCMKADRVCSEQEEAAILEGYIDDKCDDKKKTVLPGAALVGAGCGSYELITIKGLNEIRRAEVIVYDDLIDEHLLEFAPESCELIYAGKRSGRHSKAQEEINELLVAKALEGKYIVRLKGGDPYVFGRGGEEALALKAHGIPVHEVPGVTSGIGLCGMAGIPVTHRGASRGFHVITGHTADNLPPEIEEIRWKSYAKLDETFVFLMGLKSIDMITEKLMRYGKLSDTPVAVIHGENTDGTYVKLVGTLSDIAAKVKEVDFPSPAIIVVGEVASLELTD